MKSETNTVSKCCGFSVLSVIGGGYPYKCFNCHQHCDGILASEFKDSEKKMTTIKENLAGQTKARLKDSGLTPSQIVFLVNMLNRIWQKTDEIYTYTDITKALKGKPIKELVEIKRMLIEIIYDLSKYKNPFSDQHSGLST